MNSKTLWIVSFVLGIILLGVIIYGIITPPKKILGIISSPKIDMPDITSNIYKKPPVKNPNANDPKINTKSSILIDSDTHEILYQKNADAKVPIASTTKIMTSVVVLDDYSDKLNSVVSLTKDMVNIEGSNAQLLPGEKMTVANLLKGALIVSGNDAAYSLASFLGGKDEFVKKMNEKANELGLKNTAYKDPAGLNDEGYSTAFDMAVLASYALEHKTFAEIVRTPEVTVSSEDGRYQHEFKNSNRMMRTEEQYYYPFAIGIKTGFTPAAGHCLVSAAEKDGHRIIAVVFGTNEDTLTASAKESRKLLDWGFTNYSW